MSFKIGILAYSNNSGLGQMARNFRKFGIIHSQLVVTHEIKGTHKLEFPYKICSQKVTSEEFVEYLDEFHPDKLIVLETPFNWDIFKIAYDRGIKCIVIPMVDSIAFSRFEPYLKYITKFWLPTKWGYNFYKEKTDKAIYLPYPIDTDYFTTSGLSKELSNPADFLHNQGWGGAGYRKGTDCVFAAFQHLYYKYPEVTMVVRSQPCEAQYSQLRTIKNVLLHIEDVKESIDIYKDGRIYICSSRREGLGLPILEAMSCGLPVITTDAPPINEWFPADYPLLVKTRGSQPLAYGDILMYEPAIYNLMLKMEFAYKNKELMEELGRNNRIIIQDNYSWNVLKAKYIEEIESL